MFNPKGRFRNFGNLLEMNKGPNATDAEAQSIQKDYNDGFMAAENAMNKRYASGDIRGGNSALNIAKDAASKISTRAEQFNPAAVNRKQGLYGQAAGVSDFYGGQASDAARQDLSRFKNLYSTIAGRQEKSFEEPKLALPKALPKKMTLAEDQRRAKEADDRVAEGRRARGERGRSEIRAMTTLDWLLQTGRISSEQYNKAQTDPEFYNEIMVANGFEPEQPQDGRNSEWTGDDRSAKDNSQGNPAKPTGTQSSSESAWMRADAERRKRLWKNEGGL